MLLMVSATFTGMIITSFEDALSLLPVLTAFIPMLMDTGGNCGSQSSVTVIRALSLDELHFTDLFRVMWKEARTAVLCGAALAAACFLKILLVDRLLMGNESISLLVNGVVCLTLCVTVILGQVCRLHAAPVCQAPGLRPGGDGKPLYHDHRGRPELAGVFPVCEAPAGCLKRKNFV